MTHFRGKIRGAHWGPTVDHLLIEFWRKHECLFNSSIESYYDKDLKTKLWSEFASSIGKPVSDVERRSRSLRTQYGRLLWHPNRVNTFQQRMLKERLDFLRPYIIRRRGDISLEDKFDDDDDEDDNEEEETEGSIDQETGSMFGSPLDVDVSAPDPTCQPRPLASTSNTATTLHYPPAQPQPSELKPLGGSSQNAESPPGRMAGLPNNYVLDQFAEIILADMRQIQDPMVQMKLRRDITDLVFKAVEDDVQKRRVQPPSAQDESAQVHTGIAPHEGACEQTNLFCRQRVFERRNKGLRIGRGGRRWEDMRRLRRTMRSQVIQPIQRGEEPERMSEINCQAVTQPSSEIKTEIETHSVKLEEVMLPVL